MILKTLCSHATPQSAAALVASAAVGLSPALALDQDSDRSQDSNRSGMTTQQDRMSSGSQDSWSSNQSSNEYDQLWRERPDRMSGTERDNLDAQDRAAMELLRALEGNFRVSGEMKAPGRSDMVDMTGIASHRTVLSDGVLHGVVKLHRGSGGDNWNSNRDGMNRDGMNRDGSGNDTDRDATRRNRDTGNTGGERVTDRDNRAQNSRTNRDGMNRQDRMTDRDNQQRGIRDGQWMTDRLSGDGSYTGLNLISYDTDSNQFKAVWADNHTETLRYDTGTLDTDDNTISFTGTFKDPMSGEQKVMTVVMHVNEDTGKAIVAGYTMDGVAGGGVDGSQQGQRDAMRGRDGMSGTDRDRDRTRSGGASDTDGTGTDRDANRGNRRSGGDGDEPVGTPDTGTKGNSGGERRGDGTGDNDANRTRSTTGTDRGTGSDGSGDSVRVTDSDGAAQDARNQNRSQDRNRGLNTGDQAENEWVARIDRMMASRGAEKAYHFIYTPDNAVARDADNRQTDRPGVNRQNDTDFGGE